MNKLLVIGAVSLLICGCASQARQDRKADLMLSRFHTTCLKQGFGADSHEYAECVVALYEKDQELRARKRAVVAPKKPISAEAPGGETPPQDLSGSASAVPRQNDS